MDIIKIIIITIEVIIAYFIHAKKFVIFIGIFNEKNAVILNITKTLISLNKDFLFLHNNIFLLE